MIQEVYMNIMIQEVYYEYHGRRNLLRISRYKKFNINIMIQAVYYEYHDIRSLI
jgi:hypothetical protein